MAEDPNETPPTTAHFEPLDPGRLNLLDDVEVRYWCREFACTEEELRQAVARVGDHAAPVRELLGSRR